MASGKRAENGGRILVVDDEPGTREGLSEILRDDGYQVSAAANGEEALEKIRAEAPDVVISDLKMPKLDGLGLLTRALEVDPDLGFILMTAFGTIKTAVDAMKSGAADYLVKPINTEEMEITVTRCLEKRRLIQETRGLRARIDARYRFENMVGNSPQMQAVFKTVAQVAPSRSNVLITGESGTGKELIAQAIHQHSPRKDKPFVVLNCASLSETLLESELFGHEKGSFTGAVARRRGRFEQADGGTLFLDEIGDVPLPTQVKLLRFLQEREFERVGGGETLHLDVRVVAATHGDLRKLIQEGKFREDLYYRLNVIQITMPPLRDRKADIPALVDHFIRRYAAENEKRIQGIEEAALQGLIRYDWPGNIRELENIIERAVVLCAGNRIMVDNLPDLVAPAREGDGRFRFTPGITLEEAERELILGTLDAVDGQVPRAAELLGISSRKIYYRLKEYGRSGPGDPEGEG
jgi:DNA-binding NtrC family response regulator